jgi:hypothetical protein
MPMLAHVLIKQKVVVFTAQKVAKKQHFLGRNLRKMLDQNGPICYNNDMMLQK